MVRSQKGEQESRQWAVIFDFDGTLADSFARVVEIVQDLTGQQENVSAAEIERLRGMSAFQVARELHIHPWKIPFLAAQGRRRLRSEMSHIKVFKDMPEVIRALAANGHQLYIMSSNSVQNIQPFLEKQQLSREFIKIYGGVGLFGKARVLKKILKQNRLKSSQTFYIGDEVRDILAAKHAGVRMVAVTWGYNNQHAILQHEPDFIAHRPAELLTIFATIDTDGR